MPDVWLLPYLPLTAECQVGSYSLVPFRDFGRRHATSQAVYNEVRRLRTAYRVGTMGLPVGALVVPVNSRIGGDELERERFPALHSAVLAATIEANPILVGADEEGNTGHATATAENAKMFGHPLTGERSYATETGAMVTVLALQSSEPGRPLPKRSTRRPTCRNQCSSASMWSTQVPSTMRSAGIRTTRVGWRWRSIG